MIDPPRRVLVVGATGSIGHATVHELLERGHSVVAFLRGEGRRGLPEGCEVRHGDVASPESVLEDGFRGESFDAVVSCLASRTGAPADAWAVDHRAQLNVLSAAKTVGAGHFVLLSAICVQRPQLEFQRAKLAFEGALRDSGVAWSIVRPTAFFKSLSGQIDRIRAGKPYLIFGDGRLNACKPIADEDLADYLANCITDPSMRGRILPIGGPGPALTPRDQGELLFEVAGLEPRFRSVSPRLLDLIIGVLGVAGTLVPPLRERAELARIGRYYATESMLVWDEERGAYDADGTPEHGTRTLGDYFRRRLAGELEDQRGEHAVL